MSLHQHPEPAFAELLRRARRAAGLSQEELAERAGLSTRAISDLERGINRTPRRDTLAMLADALGLSGPERGAWERTRRLPTRRTTGDAAPSSNLPIQPNGFFGRAAEIAQLVQLLRQEETRLVTLTGPGGSGKTRLAIVVASSLSDDFADGTFFVDLAPITDPTLVLPAIASALGLRPPGDRLVLDVLSARLRDARLLLVLDNLEQVLSAAPEIGELLRLSTHTRVLATSRAPLRLRAEREYPVPPLPLPDSEGADMASLADATVVQLFLDRARAVRPSFDPGHDELQVTARICSRLDGLPLAVELAAACIRIFPPRTLLARLEQHLTLPASGARDVPSRQQTLEATIRWSYDLLEPPEQTLLRRLSVFQGGWTLEAAEAMAAGIPFAADSEVMQALATLVEHSLVQSTTMDDGLPRFEMLETIRAFGLDLLAARQESDSVYRLHADYMLRLFTESVKDIASTSNLRLDLLRRGDAERANVHVALGWAMGHDPKTALRLAQEYSWHWFTRGANREALGWFQPALAAAQDIPDGLRAAVLTNIGMHATSCGDYALATDSTAQSLALFRALGNEPEVARCLFGLGRIEMWGGEPAQAEAYYAASATLSRAHGQALLATTLMNWGSVRVGRGDLDGATALLDEALIQADRFGDITARGLTLHSQSNVTWLRGDLPSACRLLHASLQIVREHLDPRYAAQGLESAAWLAIQAQDAARAARLLGAAGRIRETIGVPVPPKLQLDYDANVPRGVAQLGAAPWEQSLTVGRSLSMPAALDYALDGLH